jgi:hypothetical protein
LGYFILSIINFSIFIYEIVGLNPKAKAYGKANDSLKSNQKISDIKSEAFLNLKNKGNTIK